jgi:Ca2+-binding RTX toxin-like protein
MTLILRNFGVVIIACQWYNAPRYLYCTAGKQMATQIVGTNGPDLINAFAIDPNDIYRILGLGDNDTLIGGNLNDTLEGGDGNDNFVGNDGDDLLIGGSGNNVLDGGSGFDTASYRSSPSGVTVNLVTLTASNGFGGTDTLTSIEGVSGSDFDDSLTGDASDNTFFGGAGNDTIDGGGGNNTVVYNSATPTSGVVVDLLNGTASDGFGGTDVLSNIQNATGSNLNDSITGDNGSNELRGGIGNDTLIGLDGNDTLFGGTGDDSLRGGNGNDQLFGGIGNDFVAGDAGNDTLSGGAGNDTLSGGAGNDTVVYNSDIAAVSVNLTTGTATDGFGGTDTLNNIQNIIGSDFNDTLVGNTSGNILTGGLGNDTLTGGAGPDRFAFNTPTEGIDTITDFNRVQGDRVQVSIAGFSNNSADFSYNTGTGALSFLATEFAILTGIPTFNVATDIVFV